MKESTQALTSKYYSRLGSRIGYYFVMRRSQHFGYYDSFHNDERTAQQKFNKEFISLLDLKPGMKLLDAGSGQGIQAIYIAKHANVNVMGVTITPHEVWVSRKLAKKQGAEGQTSFSLIDYSNLPFKASSFDRIYTTETLSHAPDVQEVIKGFIEVLKPGGLLVCAEYEIDHNNFDESDKEAAEFIRHNAAIHAIYQFGPGQFKKYLKDAGFVLKAEIDWTSNIKPSFDRIERIARPVAWLARSKILRRYLVNTFAASLYSLWFSKGVFSYKIYVAHKP